MPVKSRKELIELMQMILSKRPYSDVIPPVSWKAHENYKEYVACWPVAEDKVDLTPLDK